MYIVLTYWFGFGGRDGLGWHDPVYGACVETVRNDQSGRVGSIDMHACGQCIY